MIYCDLISKNKLSATYSYSCGEGKKGKITFSLGELKPYVIEEQPEKKCAEIWINKLYIKYIGDFRKEIAKEKLSYEC